MFKLLVKSRTFGKELSDREMKNIGHMQILENVLEYLSGNKLFDLGFKSTSNIGKKFLYFACLFYKFIFEYFLNTLAVIPPARIIRYLTWSSN